jgi:hypothetical protein
MKLTPEDTTKGTSEDGTDEEKTDALGALLALIPATEEEGNTREKTSVTQHYSSGPKQNSPHSKTPKRNRRAIRPA